MLEIGLERGLGASEPPPPLCSRQAAGGGLERPHRIREPVLAELRQLDRSHDPQPAR